MGLDMYLYKDTYIGNQYKEPDKQTNIDIPGIKQERVSVIRERVAYWRKSNQVHKWFVDHAQGGTDKNGEYSEVTANELQALVNDCKAVLESPNLAESMLPNQSGFFFGSTDYDEWYFKDLQSTVDQLQPLIDEESDGDYYYHSSW